MSQTRGWSLIEAWLGVAIGFAVTAMAQPIVYPWFGMHPNMKENLSIALIFTVLSIIRSYIVRRGFNWYHAKQNR